MKKIIINKNKNIRFTILLCSPSISFLLSWPFFVVFTRRRYSHLPFLSLSFFCFFFPLLPSLIYYYYSILESHIHIPHHHIFHNALACVRGCVLLSQVASMHMHVCMHMRLTYAPTYASCVCGLSLYAFVWGAYEAYACVWGVRMRIRHVCVVVYLRIRMRLRLRRWPHMT